MPCARRVGRGAWGWIAHYPCMAHRGTWHVLTSTSVWCRQRMVDQTRFHACAALLHLLGCWPTAITLAVCPAITVRWHPTPPWACWRACGQMHPVHGVACLTACDVSHGHPSHAMMACMHAHLHYAVGGKGGGRTAHGTVPALAAKAGVIFDTAPCELDAKVTLPALSTLHTAAQLLLHSAPFTPKACAGLRSAGQARRPHIKLHSALHAQAGCHV